MTGNIMVFRIPALEWFFPAAFSVAIYSGVKRQPVGRLVGRDVALNYIEPLLLRSNFGIQQESDRIRVQGFLNISG